MRVPKLCSDKRAVLQPSASTAGQDRPADSESARLVRTDQLTLWVQGWSGAADLVGARLLGVDHADPIGWRSVYHMG